ncbi:hypothetical protein NE865_07845 [Phthorimaea operculella]|nr:hypothetical protein NE865_07845 [Phthorimaea operculella]
MSKQSHLICKETIPVNGGHPRVSGQDILAKFAGSIRTAVAQLVVASAVQMPKVAVNSASILDYLDIEDGKKLIDVPELRQDQPNRNCMCKGPACVCCVDFNITLVDLGGPADQLGPRQDQLNRNCMCKGPACVCCVDFNITLVDLGGPADQLEPRQEQLNRNFICKGPACVCCVDFNITLVDLGGPGCVHMKYVSPEEGFSVNVSYGKNLIHSSKIQGANPAPICLEVFGKFAQVCAKFSDLAPTADGLRGCLGLEPKLLGESQLEFPIGCFKSTSGGMEMEEPPAETEETTEESEDNSTESSGGFDAETFLLGVYQTAEQGVAFLSSLLDLPNKLNSTRPATTTTTAKPEQTSSSSTRGGKNLKHPNQL